MRHESPLHRRRRKQARKAGTEPALRLSRGDLATLRQAGRTNWNVPDLVRNETLYRLYAILTGPKASARARLGAAKCLAVLDRTDIESERLAFEKERAGLGDDRPTATEIILQMRKAALDHENDENGNGNGIPHPG
jgi:hypothetical protein